MGSPGRGESAIRTFRCAEAAWNTVETHVRPVRFESLDGEATIYADCQLLQIAIANLVDNAIKYSSPDNEICLKVLRPRTDRLCIEVIDHGPGISSHLQENIFRKYARGQHEANIQGSGLGLYLADWISKFHGGYTEVYSTEGVGSTFRLHLPIYEPDSLPQHDVNGMNHE